MSSKIPWQTNPSPVNPVEHSQVNPPTTSVHCAFS
ncbi:hypothetical protein GBAR_LOCUS13203 [Geodia barretti]|uniref:Uncharacterized protein n=1 Tax=Geodia barretti TaxID=519541 RepID=A0AA35WMN2_GEOBA|nr:hypothetical protein GBAR_LOCUS13203 [Geodia barretti]